MTDMKKKFQEKNGIASFSPLPGSDVSGRSIVEGQEKIRRILGIDPGLANTGFGIVDFYGNKYKMVGYGVIQTPSDMEHGRRLELIYDSLEKIVKEFKPSQASMETLYFARNVTSAISVAQARGVVTLCLCKKNIPLFEYTPNQIKQAVCGTASADKALVQKYVRILLNLETDPKPDHAADALAGAITHLHYTSNI